MKILNWRTAIILFVISINSIYGQKAGSLTLDDLAFLAGHWSGHMEFLEYKDDSTIVKFSSGLDFERKKDKYEYVFSYTQSNGNKVYNIKNILEVKKNKLIINNEEWDINVLTREDSTISFHTSLQTKGDDGDKPALIIYNLMLENKILTMRKMVRYDGEEEFFVRNSYMVIKKDGE
jgi:hypothetical protein